MAERKPLTLNGGRVQELGLTDSLVVGTLPANNNTDSAASTKFVANAMSSNVSSSQAIYVRDEKTNNTSGQTPSAGQWNVRHLNTVMRNTIAGASLGTNQIVLPAGTYEVYARAPGPVSATSRTRLFNNSNSTILLVGCNGNNGGDSVLQGVFTLAAQQTVSLEQYTLGNQPMGAAVGAATGTSEVYSEIIIRKQ